MYAAIVGSRKELTADQRKGLDVITLFHSPTAPASMRVHSLLKQASAAAGETATEDQASDHTQQTKSSTQTQFELNVIEDAPTPDQLKSILEYVGENGAGKVVQGATSGKDAFTKWKKDSGSFQRPLVSSQQLERRGMAQADRK